LIPKKASGSDIKYRFEEMKIGVDYIIAGDYNHARSICVCALKRDYKACIRTVGEEVRVYLVEKNSAR
jgi:hypothetical protein